jgi:hypothetical protein
VFLANPRWERRFVKFLELSGVGRMMALAPLGWTSGKRRRGSPYAANLHTPLFLFFVCKGVVPRQRTAEGGVLSFELTGRGPEAGFFCVS